VILRRSRFEPETLKVRHLVDLDEQRYPAWSDALQGLLRGEIDAVPLTEYRDVRALQGDQRFFVLQQALPRTHLITIHPASPLARNSSWRRALSLAIPREPILRDQVLDGQDSAYGRLSVGPFPSSLTASPRQLTPPAFAPSSALALLATAKTEAGGSLPVLRLLAPTEPTVARALPSLLAAWKRIGIVVEQVDSPEAGWDLAYRTLQLTEPVVDFWPLISPSGRAELAAITPFPHPVREQLLELDRTIDWTSALRQLERLQSEFLAEARYLPLWEVEEFMTVRRRVGNLIARPLDPYQGCERWTVQSWYPTETP
jgi:ABC-type transport system substrate-binding protein